MDFLIMKLAEEYALFYVPGSCHLEFYTFEDANYLQEFIH